METKNKKPEKKPARPAGGFDAIKTMRKIRDEISLEIMNMTYEEEREYLDKLLSEGKAQAEKS